MIQFILTSREVLQSLTSTDLSNEAFKFNTHKLMTVGGHTVRAIRLSFVGELGWELHVTNETSVAVYQAVMEAGARFGITNGGYRALDSLSLEKGGLKILLYCWPSPNGGLWSKGPI